MPLDPRIEAIRETYGLSRDDMWELPQKKGTWIVKHSGLEVAAVKAGIRFDMPQILEANGAEGACAVCVQGEMAGRVEWSVGEASPKNNKNAYPWAMAEKRAKDRVILKLIGLHGLVYSEEEADDFKGGAPNAAPAAMPRISSYLAKKLLKTDVLLADIDTAGNEKRCAEIEAMFGAELAWLPDSWLVKFRERLAERRVEIGDGVVPKEPGQSANESLDRQFAETMRE